MKGRYDLLHANNSVGNGESGETMVKDGEGSVKQYGSVMVKASRGVAGCYMIWWW